MFVNNLSNDDSIPNITLITPLYLDSIETKLLIHNLKHCLRILQLGSESKSYNIITILHDLHARTPQICMRDTCFNGIALTRWQFSVFEQTGHQYTDVVWKLFLQSEQNVFPLWQYRVNIL
jgi:hypothetical protein